ncbi:hypothetical protein RSOLAG22IIIB_06375 [Rhizoctonia solani]|uniref:Uncharacterized protein n=1 Tax=Rhizoctonia solani TaxID=456999 RepID=A0A0K6GE14_9AGAM|nr:hypothetical protein RSOLAG22IIIB_06375 [Rhizoctonia solani]
MRFITLSLAIIAAVVGNAAAERFVNPSPANVRRVDLSHLPPAPQPVTNAKRFSQGLPPIKPRSRKHRAANIGNDALKRATHVASAPRSQTSPSVPVQKRCNILVQTEGQTLGYIGRELILFGQYGLFESNQRAALEVSFSYSPGSDTPVDWHATNGPTAAYPYVGGAVGYYSNGANLGPGSSNHIYVAATNQAPSGSPPSHGDNSVSTTSGKSADYESAIWIYDPATNNIRAQWINADGSAPTTYLVYSSSDVAFILSGDINALSVGNPSNYFAATFTCVPPVLQPA